MKSYGKWPQLDGMVLDMTKDPGQEDFGSAYNVIDAFQSTFRPRIRSTSSPKLPVDAAKVVSDFDISRWVDRVISWPVARRSSVDYAAFGAKGGKIIHFSAPRTSPSRPTTPSTSTCA